MAAQYPIRAVSRITGIPVDTLRAWERRYQAVRPERSGRGRVYGDADIRRLILLREAVDRGHAIGQAAKLSDAELEELLASARFAPAIPERQGVPARIQPVLEKLSAFDYDGTIRELGRLALLLDPRELIYGALVPLMQTAGERWEKGTFQVAHEHLLSASVRNLLGALLLRQPAAEGAPRFLFTTPPGELHEFGVLAAAMLAAVHRLPAAYLGPNLPAAEIRMAVEKLRARVVAVGIMEVNATAEVRQEMTGLLKELPPGTELWVGGSGRNVAAGLGANVVLVKTLEEFERRLPLLNLSA